jgi:hypothetical protein
MSLYEFRDKTLCAKCKHGEGGDRCTHPDIRQIVTCTREADRMMEKDSSLEKRVERLESDLKDIVNGLRNIGQIWRD